MTDPADQPTRPRTAGLLIEVFPIGRPGYVRYEVSNAGPLTLSQAEALRVLAAVRAQVEANAMWPE